MHIKLITQETLCGEPATEGNCFSFDGRNHGPLDEIGCDICRETLRDLLTCPGCSGYVQLMTTKIVLDVAQRRPTVDNLDELLATYKSWIDMEGLRNHSPLVNDPVQLTAADFNERSSPAYKALPYKISNMIIPETDDPNQRKEEKKAMTIKQPAEAKETTTVINVDVVRYGDKLILPDGLEYADAIRAIQSKAAEESQTIQISHDFNLTPPEGAIAFLRTLTEMFGFISPKGSPGFFGPQPPDFITVETGPGTTESIPWGRMEIPGIKGHLQPGIHWSEGSPYFRLAGSVKGRDKAMVQKIADNIRKRTDSLYRGKAIYATFPEPGSTDNIEDYFPKFMDLPKVDENDLIFSTEIQDLIATALFTPIEHSQVCREEGISLKRGILLEGPYGVGKTLTATVTARKCVSNNWTFIYLKNVKQLPHAVRFAKIYAPAVIFGEDIDQVLADPNHRDAAVNAILNTIDGIDSKGAEIITVLTTNNVAKITTAMLRPGRLDTVVPVRPPDAEAAIRLVRLFAGDQLADDQDLTVVGERLNGTIPAMIEEVVKRSKLGAVRRSPDSVRKITAYDIEIAATSLLAHNKLIEPKTPDTRSEREKAADILGNKIGESLSALVAGVSKPSNGKSTQLIVEPVPPPQLPTTAS